MSIRGTLLLFWDYIVTVRKDLFDLSPTVCEYYADSENPQLYNFADSLAVPDPYLTQDYTTRHKGRGTPIIIDNGTCTCTLYM